MGNAAYKDSQDIQNINTVVKNLSKDDTVKNISRDAHLHVNGSQHTPIFNDNICQKCGNSMNRANNLLDNQASAKVSVDKIVVHLSSDDDIIYNIKIKDQHFRRVELVMGTVSVSASLINGTWQFRNETVPACLIGQDYCLRLYPTKKYNPVTVDIAYDAKQLSPQMISNMKSKNYKCTGKIFSGGSIY